MPSGRFLEFLPSLLVHASAVAIVLATLALVGQPLFANDTWIHLALGQAFAASGPWLSADPHLFAAPGPPSPSSWLGSLAIFGAYDLFGFTGLRILHALAVGLLLALAWWVVFRGTRSRLMASAGVVFFVVLSTYRIVQLRPHLLTIGAVLVLYLIVIAPRAGPGRGATAWAAFVSIIWANVHAAFLLGPILVLGVSASLFAFDHLPGRVVDGVDRLRARRIGLAGIAMGLASFLNPQGWHAHAAYFSSGDQTLALSAVLDEWGSTNLLAWPVERLPPTLAAWWLCWLCVIGVVWGAWTLFAREWRQEKGASGDSADPWVDPALLALSVASLAAAVIASRFLWMGLFPLMLFGRLLLREGATVVRGPAVHWLVACVVAVAGLGHFKVGDWPLVSRALGGSLASYAEPYRAAKYFGHAIWFLEDSGVAGRIFNDYPLGGFMSFWLTPELQMASSGTMNVERTAMEAQLLISSGRTPRPDESLAALLDRLGFDLFLGTGLPVERPASRPGGSSVRLLEREPGWIQIFRDLRSAVYLRRGDRNAENLERVVAYYAAQGVPFDREAGFDPGVAMTQAPDWAKANGVIPLDFEARVAWVESNLARNQLDPEVDRLALLYAVLGRYDLEEALDRAILRIDPRNVAAAQRIIWGLLQRDLGAEVLAAARSFDRGPLASGQPGSWLAAVEAYRNAPPSVRLETLNQLPLMSAAQGRWLQQGLYPPKARLRRGP